MLTRQILYFEKKTDQFFGIFIDFLQRRIYYSTGLFFRVGFVDVE